MLIGNAIVGQSGGPTSALNATLAGVIRGAYEAKEEGAIRKIYGMKNGIDGFMAETLVSLDSLTEEDLVTLENTPAAALGTCRRKLKVASENDAEYKKIFALFAKYDIRYFFYIGGNDSMDTVAKLSAYAANADYEIRIVGVPKTIDNDLMATDHTPGFGSAAKFVATTVKEVIRDVSIYTVPAVTIMEIMGRDAGWLTASAVLPRVSGGVEPDLIYLPEVAFDTEEFLTSVRAALAKHPAVLVCVSEGIRFADGEYVGSSSQSGAVDVFGHKYLAGAGRVLEAIVKEKIGCKVRSMELSLTQRAAAHIASKTDLSESVMIGKSAVAHAVAGETGIMMIFERTSDEPYHVTVSSRPVSGIANGVRAVPRNYINEAGNGITDACVKYLLPLIQGETNPTYENGMPKHFVID